MEQEGWTVPLEHRLYRYPRGAARAAGVSWRGSRAGLEVPVGLSGTHWGDVGQIKATAVRGGG